MTKDTFGKEPSMAEILASVRRIVADDMEADRAEKKQAEPHLEAKTTTEAFEGREPANRGEILQHLLDRQPKQEKVDNKPAANPGLDLRADPSFALRDQAPKGSVDKAKPKKKGKILGLSFGKKNKADHDKAAPKTTKEDTSKQDDIKDMAKAYRLEPSLTEPKVEQNPKEQAAGNEEAREKTTKKPSQQPEEKGAPKLDALLAEGLALAHELGDHTDTKSHQPKGQVPSSSLDEDDKLSFHKPGEKVPREEVPVLALGESLELDLAKTGGQEPDTAKEEVERNKRSKPVSDIDKSLGEVAIKTDELDEESAAAALDQAFARWAEGPGKPLLTEMIREEVRRTLKKALAV